MMKGFIGISTALLVTLFIALASLSALLANVSGLLQEPETSLGGIQGQATSASTTTFTISTTAIRIAASSSCAARIISPNTSASVNLAFNPNIAARPTATAGHMLSGTTSPQAFPSENYGCTEVWAIRNTANDAPITVTEIK